MNEAAWWGDTMTPHTRLIVGRETALRKMVYCRRLRCGDEGITLSEVVAGCCSGG